jgi:selenocysteine-specific elongation factor
MDLQRDAVVSAEALAAAANLRVGDVHAALRKEESLTALPDGGSPEAYARRERWEALGDALVRRTALFHQEHPRSAGMEMESLHSQVIPGLPVKIFRIALQQLEKKGALARDGSVVRLPSHSVGLDQKQQEVASQVLRAIEAGGFTPPDLAELAAALSTDAEEIRFCIEQLERDGRAQRIDDKLAYATGALDRVRDIVRDHVAAHGEIDARGLRDRIGASRKYSIALLTFFDRTGFTMRIGDVRKLREKPAAAPAGARGGGRGARD